MRRWVCDLCGETVDLEDEVAAQKGVIRCSGRGMGGSLANLDKCHWPLPMTEVEISEEPAVVGMGVVGIVKAKTIVKAKNMRIVGADSSIEWDGEDWRQDIV